MSYEKRDADFREWCKQNDVKPTVAVRDAFNAGWRARKHVDYRAALAPIMATS